MRGCSRRRTPSRSSTSSLGCPAARCVTYGDVAGLAGGSALSVGNVMSRFGSGVPWWRVIRAGGLLPPGHEVEAARRLQRGTGARSGCPRERVDLERCRWRPDDE